MARGQLPGEKYSSESCRGFRKNVLSVLVPGLLAMTPTLAAASPPLPIASQTAIFSEPADPTAAWSQFCTQLPAECAIDLSEPDLIELTPEVWRNIVRINTHVNKAILAVTDLDHWGVVDRWDYPDDGMGDCEDIQLLKRRLLVQTGLPHRAMRMTVVIDEMGEGHAIMMVRTDHGDFVLDNKRDQVLPWEKTGYAYVKRESAARTGWIYYSGAADPVVTANQ